MIQLYAREIVKNTKKIFPKNVQGHIQLGNMVPLNGHGLPLHGVAVSDVTCESDERDERDDDSDDEDDGGPLSGPEIDRHSPPTTAHSSGGPQPPHHNNEPITNNLSW